MTKRRLSNRSKNVITHNRVRTLNQDPHSGLQPWELEITAEDMQRFKDRQEWASMTDEQKRRRLLLNQTEKATK